MSTVTENSSRSWVCVSNCKSHKLAGHPVSFSFMGEKNWVYILLCEDGSYYTGWTNDLIGRYQRHCQGKGAKYTHSHHPLAIAYAKCYDSRREAMSQEWHLKQLSHAEKKDLIAAYEAENKGEKIMEELKIYRCRKCGKIVIETHASGCVPVCCGEEMELLKANTTDGAAEKHVPVVVREDGKVIVNVGSVDHPMLPEHYIEFIVLQSENGFRVVKLNPGEKPRTELYADEPVKAVYEFCNLHGLWKTEI